MSELRRIPGVGKETEKDLLALGYTTIESLRDQDRRKYTGGTAGDRA